MPPRVSFCVPNLDMGVYLERCVESCLAQTFSDLEVVVVDNRSRDDSLAVLERLARRDARVRWYGNAERLGMAANWNESVRRARGEYVVLLCADDAQEPGFAARLVPLLDAHPTASHASAERWDVDLADRRLRAHQFYERAALIPGLAEARIAIAANHAVMNQLLVRRETWLRVGGSDARFDWAHDLHLKLKLALAGDVVYVPEPLCRYRQNPAASSARMLADKLGVMEIYRVRCDVLRNLPQGAESLRERLPAVRANLAKLALRNGLAALASELPEARTLAEEYLHLAQSFDLAVRVTPLFARLAAELGGAPAPIEEPGPNAGPPYPLPPGSRSLEDLAVSELAP